MTLSDIFSSAATLPRYVAELGALGTKYNIPVDINPTNKTIEFSAKAATASDGRNGFTAAAEDVRAHYLDWRIVYTD